MCQCLHILCSKCFSTWGNFLAPVFLLQLIMYTLSLNCAWARILIGSQGALLESKIHLGFLLVFQLGPDSPWTAPLKSFANFPSFSPSPVESLLDCKHVYLWIRPCLPRALINIQSFFPIHLCHISQGFTCTVPTLRWLCSRSWEGSDATGFSWKSILQRCKGSIL